MPHTQKIATCCYCGTRAARVLKGRERHELACSRCGAPLHDLKMLRSYSARDRDPVRQSSVGSSEWQGRVRRKPSKKKKSRSLSQRFMHEFWDAAEDILDIFD